MELGKAIVERSVGFLEQVNLSMAQVVINEELYSLDLVRHRMEMKWGFGPGGVSRLIELASWELGQKWAAQVEKLEQAILTEDIVTVKDLIGGCQRGWTALEQAAVTAGHVPYEPLFWTVLVSGTEYRIVRSNEDASVMGLWEGQGDAWTCVTMDELVRGHHARHELVLGAPMRSGEMVPSGKSMDEEIPW
jgi:hypothetical protein